MESRTHVDAARGGATFFVIRWSGVGNKDGRSIRKGEETITTINNKYNLITGYPGKKKQKDFGHFFNVEFVDGKYRYRVAS